MKATPVTVIQAAPLLVDRDSAARALGISVSTLEALVRAGKLAPPRQISKGRTGWRWTDLQRFADSLPVSELLPPPAARGGQPGE